LGNTREASSMTSRDSVPCTFVPPHLLRQISLAQPDRSLYQQALVFDQQFREQRAAATPHLSQVGAAGGAWTIYDGQGQAALPGVKARQVGDDPTGDDAVDEAAQGVAASLALFSEVFGRSSYDGKNAPVAATVHHRRDYVNAFWDGEQLVFGDGDGQIFTRFTKPIDVVGHEFAHAVTEYTAGLVYRDQPGALNESISDVFAACLKQRLLGQSPTEADWLIGEGLFLPGVQARGLRDMVNPGTAYDDPTLGKDPQVGHLRDFIDTQDDNGGVHLNSGIPNRAFALAAQQIGTSAAEGAGRIWFAALTGTKVGPNTTFAGFAAATVAAAGEHAAVVADAWQEVGVTPESGVTDQPPKPPAGKPASLVVVRRSGGFTGQVAVGQLDLDGDDSRVPELRRLLERVNLAGLPDEDPNPDGYVYSFEVCGQTAHSVPEHCLSAELSELVELLLHQPR
jgi:hypothetical protein